MQRSARVFRSGLGIARSVLLPSVPDPGPNLMIPTVSVAPAAEKISKKPGKRDIALLLLMAWIIPLTVHVISRNSAVPWEDYVLPLYWVTLAAVYLFGTGAGLFVGLSAPLVQYLLIGFPDTRSVALLAVQVAVFVGITRVLIRRAPGFWWVAPFAYVGASAVVVALRELLDDAPNFWLSHGVLLRQLQTALPGLAILAFLHFVLVKLRPQPDDWDAT